MLYTLPKKSIYALTGHNTKWALVMGKIIYHHRNNGVTKRRAKFPENGSAFIYMYLLNTTAIPGEILLAWPDKRNNSEIRPVFCGQGDREGRPCFSAIERALNQTGTPAARQKVRRWRGEGGGGKRESLNRSPSEHPTSHTIFVVSLSLFWKFCLSAIAKV